MEAETQQLGGGSGARGFRGREAAGNSVMLGPRDSLVGKLTIEGDLRVQGTVDGELHATGDVVIDASATVNAPIQGRNVSVRGQVTGSVNAQERLLVAGSGVLTGDVQVGRLAIEDGATLNGKVSMSPGSGGSHRQNSRTSTTHAERAPDGEEALGPAAST